MSTGLVNFDRTLEMTHLWLNEIGESDAIGPDKQRQYHALRAVLWTLRDRMTIAGAFDLSSHLPILVRGMFWENYRPAGKPETYRTVDEFVERVAAALDGAVFMNPLEATRAVLGVVARRVSGGEMRHVIDMMPEGLRTLFPQD